MTKLELMKKFNLRAAKVAQEGDIAYFVCEEVKIYKSAEGKAYSKYKGTALNEEGEQFAEIEVMAPRFILSDPLGCLFTIKLVKGEPKADPKTGKEVTFLNWTIID